MHLHEYQAKEILDKFGLPVPPGIAVSAQSEAVKVIQTLGLTEAVLKVQVHAGGRGKAGGVLFAKGEQEILASCSQLLGLKIVNEQTGPRGLVAHQVLISAPVDIAKEFYLSALIDREQGKAILMASAEGGMEIEKIAAESPEEIVTCPIQADGSIRSYDYIRMAKKLGWKWKGKDSAKFLVNRLAKALLETDASLIEINPLVETKQGELIVLDAKMTIDDSALFRHPDLAKLYDATQLPAAEVRAHELELAYIPIGGNIGCMVNGAGLAMATMDLIHHHGGMPANFLDVGGGASEEKVAEGFRLILSDRNVEAILVNIFGGIMDCGVLAKGILEAASGEALLVPLIVRMEGTNVEIGRKLLAESDLEIIVAKGLSEAAEKAVNAVQRK